MASLIEGIRGRNILAHNGFRYHKNKSTANAIYWRCWRKTCGASLKTNHFNFEEDAPAIQVLYEPQHLHIGDQHQIQKDKAIHRLKEAVREDVTRPIKRVYEAVARHRGHQGGGDRDQLQEFHSVRTIMQRARSDLLPPIPQECADVRIEGEWANTWSHERFLLHLDNDWGVAVFATDENLQKLRRCRDVYMDGTFRTCPSPYQQFFTIHGKYRERVLPFASVLLTGKTIGHYRKVLQVLKREIRRRCGHRWRPNRVVYDFEQSIINAVETELPRSRVTCCYFHFCQSMWRRLQELGLSGRYQRHERLRKCIRRFLSMGYLPLAIVRQNFHQFCVSRGTQRILQQYPELHDFIRYIERNYFDGNFPPVMWNVYDRNADTRTNNYVEG